MEKRRAVSLFVIAVLLTACATGPMRDRPLQGAYAGGHLGATAGAAAGGGAGSAIGGLIGLGVGAVAGFVKATAEVLRERRDK